MVSSEDEPVVIHEVNTERLFGEVIGSCKWFNKKLGYGFITIYTGEHKGKNVFVHHSGIEPLNSHFKTLRKGEYVSLNIIEGINGSQGVEVKGVCGGPLMCDHIDILRKYHEENTQDNITRCSQ
jgi:cold shock CspA family protein